MANKEEVIKYRLPWLSNLSGTIGLIGLVSFAGLSVMHFVENSNQMFKFSFVMLSLSPLFLGSTGLSFSEEGYPAYVKKMKVIFSRRAKLLIWFLCLPIVGVFFDKNISQGDITYTSIFCLLYVFVFCYAVLLAWYIKNHSN